MGSGKYLRRAIEKNEIDNFEKEILFIYDNPEAMYQKENEIVNEEFLTKENTYNLKVGGFGGFDYINSNKMNAGVQYMKENSKEMGSAGLKAAIAKYGKLWVKENALKATKRRGEKFPNGTFFGKKHSEETKRKISEKNSINLAGENNSQYGTIWITNNIENKKMLKTDVIPEGWRKGRKINMLDSSIG